MANLDSVMKNNPSAVLVLSVEMIASFHLQKHVIRNEDVALLVAMQHLKSEPPLEAC